MNIFYSRDIQGNIGIFDETESHHCIKVLRLSIGDAISVIDGRDRFYEGVIIDPNPKKCMIEIRSSVFDFGKRSYRLHIAIAPTKNIERFEWFLEKATEIGVDEITPLICQRSERRNLRLDRLEKLISSAMKQSLKAFLPRLNSPVSFEEFISKPFSGDKMIAHCMETDRKELIKQKPSGTEFLIIIGPEGDFSESEVKIAVQNGFIPVSMGDSRLRTETAGIVACQIIADLIALK